MTQDAEPLGHEEEISVSKHTVISDEWPSRPADCVSSPRSTSVFGFYPGYSHSLIREFKFQDFYVLILMV